MNQLNEGFAVCYVLLVCFTFLKAEMPSLNFLKTSKYRADEVGRA